MEGDSAVNVTGFGAHWATLNWTNLFSPEADIADKIGGHGLPAKSSADHCAEIDRISDSDTKDTYEAFLDLAYTKPQEEEQYDQEEEDKEPDLEAAELIDETPVFEAVPKNTCLVQVQIPKRGWVPVYFGSGTHCHVSQLLSDQENFFRLKIFRCGVACAQWIYLSVVTSGSVVSGRELTETAKRGNASDVTDTIARLQKTSQIERINACADQGLTPLVACALRGAKESLAMLLEGGAGPQVVTDGAQFAPLHGVAFGGYKGLVKRMEALGASWNDRDRVGYCGLEYAIWGCQDEVVKMALKSKNPLTKRPIGIPILSVAVASLAYQRYRTYNKRNVSLRFESSESKVDVMEEIISTLIDNGADINEKGVDGNTALHLAVILEEENTVQIFMRHGADSHIQNSLGHTPLYLAKWTKLKGILKP